MAAVTRDPLIDDAASERPSAGPHGPGDDVQDEKAIASATGVPAGGLEHEPVLTPPRSRTGRVAFTLACPTLGAAVMLGGAFEGVSPRIVAAAAGLLGVGLATQVSRLRRPLITNLAIVGGVFAIGLLAVVPTGVGNLGGLRGLLADAAASGNVLRPPVPFSPGWHAIVGWLMALLGFVTTWVGLVFRRPALAMLLPLPFAAIAGISAPADAQLPSGAAVLVLFAIGLGSLSMSQSLGDTEAVPLGYELRRAAKSLPLLVMVVVALVLLSRNDFLFPEPAINPAQEAQKPKTVSLTEVEDRVLFTVESGVTGPWRIGSLDVFDGKDWRLPPFAENDLEEVAESGIVDQDLVTKQGAKATFTVAGLSGVVLPTLPNTVGVLAHGPKLAYDERSGNIRVDEGQLAAGLQYTVTAAALPTVEELMQVTDPIPPEVAKFAEIPIAPPPAARALIDSAPKSSKWAEFDFLRTHVLDNVVASGPGIPASIPAERVQQILTGAKEGSPYEIVALQAMFARWIGVPARIGYGFDGGDLVDGLFQVRPADAASFVEVYFPGYKWLPVIGTPRTAKATLGGDGTEKNVDPSVLPSDEVGVELLLPSIVLPPSILLDQIRRLVLVLMPLLLLGLLLYVLYPAVKKAWLRSRARAAALHAGDRARIALAYAEWRDLATDFGFGDSSATPLMYLERVAEDREHTALAWLVTRALWGDLQDKVSPDMATAAEELSRALRQRLSSAQPITVRAVAFVSRLSLRDPFPCGLPPARRPAKLDPERKALRAQHAS